MYKYKLEQIEWTNIWREDADNAEKPRLLLIGDSITQGYSAYVNRALDKKWALTMLTTSKGIDNPSLLEEIFLLAKQENDKYDYIHFNNGLHAGYITDEDYEMFYQQTIWALRDHFPASKLSIATSTTTCKKENGVMVLSDGDAKTVRRNEIVRRLAQSSKLPLDDLYTVSLTDLSLHCDDCTHFKPEGYELLGKAVAAFLMSL
ncbi:MAG: SGNH/GDSL hydrolase family protein [Clostridia bacterium]|nr:SGNH/GDSL hydrolase family protein [Clostridia bacterium]